MTWGTIGPAIITAGAAFLGVSYGARLSTRRETVNWTREQRLKAYTELLEAIEKCYEAFTLIAASLSLAHYDERVRTDPKIINTSTEWGEWDEKVDRFLPHVELICSRTMWPYITYIRLGVRSRHRMLLMQLAYGQEINQKEWDFVSSKTHGEILEIRRRLREDLTRIDPAPNSFDQVKLRLRIMRGHAARRLRAARPDKHHEVGSASQTPN